MNKLLLVSKEDPSGRGIRDKPGWPSPAYTAILCISGWPLQGKRSVNEENILSHMDRSRISEDILVSGLWE